MSGHNVDLTVATVPIQSASVTIPTAAGSTDAYVIAPTTGTLSSAVFSGVDALATSNSNYVTFLVTNLGQAGAGTAEMLAGTAVNTTKTTGGSALSANTARTLTLTSTTADLVVTAGDTIRVRYTGTGTLANTVTFSKTLLLFTRS